MYLSKFSNLEIKDSNIFIAIQKLKQIKNNLIKLNHSPNNSFNNTTLSLKSQIRQYTADIRRIDNALVEYSSILDIAFIDNVFSIERKININIINVKWYLATHLYVTPFIDNEYINFLKLLPNKIKYSHLRKYSKNHINYYYSQLMYINRKSTIKALNREIHSLVSYNHSIRHSPI